MTLTSKKQIHFGRNVIESTYEMTYCGQLMNLTFINVFKTTPIYKRWHSNASSILFTTHYILDPKMGKKYPNKDHPDHNEDGQILDPPSVQDIEQDLLRFHKFFIKRFNLPDLYARIINNKNMVLSESLKSFLEKKKSPS